MCCKKLSLKIIPGGLSLWTPYVPFHGYYSFSLISWLSAVISHCLRRPPSPSHLSPAFRLGLDTVGQHVSEIRGPGSFRVGQGHGLWHSDFYKDSFDNIKVFFPFFFFFSFFLICFLNFFFWVIEINKQVASCK